MNIQPLIADLDARIAKLQEAKTVLLALSDSPATPAQAKRGRPKGSGKKTSIAAKRGPGRPKGSNKKSISLSITGPAAERLQAHLDQRPAIHKRTMSPEGKARIAAAQKARWAKAKKS